MTNNKRGPGAPRLRGRRLRVPGELLVRVRERQDRRRDQPGDQEDLRATWRGRGGRASSPGKPSRVTLGGINLGRRRVLQEPRPGAARRPCASRSPTTRSSPAEKGGLRADERGALPGQAHQEGVSRSRSCCGESIANGVAAAGHARRTATSRSRSSRRCTRRRTSSPRRRSRT